MRQSRVMSLVEAIANVVIGLLVAVATQIVVFPVLGLQASLGQNVRLAMVSTAVSIVRSFLLRRFFEGLQRRDPQQHRPAALAIPPSRVECTLRRAHVAADFSYARPRESSALRPCGSASSVPI